MSVRRVDLSQKGKKQKFYIISVVFGVASFSFCNNRVTKLNTSIVHKPKPIIELESFWNLGLSC